MPVRHGLTVDQIIKESNTGDFDLIVTGTLHVPAGKSWHELRGSAQKDIADRVLTEAQRPVLIVRNLDLGVDWTEM